MQLWHVLVGRGLKMQWLMVDDHRLARCMCVSGQLDCMTSIIPQVLRAVKS
jgi:hypothetical protein